MAHNLMHENASIDNYVSGSGYWMNEAETSFYARFSNDDGSEFAIVVEIDDSCFNDLSALHAGFGTSAEFETMMTTGVSAMQSRGITIMKQNLDVLGISYASDATFEQLEALVLAANTTNHETENVGLQNPDLTPVISVDKTKLNN